MNHATAIPVVMWSRVSWIWKSPGPQPRWWCMTMTTYSPEGMVFCSRAGSWSITCRTSMLNGCNSGGLPLTYQKRMETSPVNVMGTDPINTSDSKESMLEEDPELADDLCNIILDDSGEEQPCPVGTAADPVMDPQAEAVTSTPSPDAATLPKEEALCKPPSSNPTKTTQDLSAQDVVILLHEEEMTEFP